MLYKPGRYENLKDEMSALWLDIFNIAETRWTDDGNISDEYYQMIYSGVGIMMKKHIAACILGYLATGQFQTGS